MTLTNSLSSVRLGAVKDAGQKHAETFQLFFSSAATSDARSLYFKFFHGEESPMSLINVSLIADYPITVNNRLNKRPIFFVNSI